MADESDKPVAEKIAPVTKSRKRKRAESSKVEDMMGKLMKMQEESDEHYMRIEEKLLEMEKQRQKESQEFQLRMMALLSNPQVPPVYDYPQENSRYPRYPYMPQDDTTKF